MKKSSLVSTISRAASAHRSLGAVDTPPSVVDFMVSLANLSKGKRARVLEPACGMCPFLDALNERYPNLSCQGIDIDGSIVAKARRAHPSFNLKVADFLLWQPAIRYDLVIGNPPYGIIGDASHYPIFVLKNRKERYRQICETWRGKYNIYGAFIEKGVKLLAPGGRLVFVVPASFMVLDDFQKLRRFLAQAGRVSVHYLGSVFPGRTVTAVVLVLTQGEAGLELWDHGKAVLRRPEYHGEMIRFETEATRRFHEDGTTLGRLFNIHFAARSPEIRRHPLVSVNQKNGFVPILTGRNLKSGWIDYETPYSGLWMPRKAAPTLRSFYGFPHLVIGHTKGSRLVAAVDRRCYPWREEFHLVPRVNGINLDAFTRYLNSQDVQDYLRTLYRDLIPHLTMTQLKSLPVPKEMVSIAILEEDNLPLASGA